MNEELGRTALAGLLHDIGKFGQRAGETAMGKKDHASIGEKFVNTFVPKAWQAVSALVAWHHGDPEGRGHEVFPALVLRVADRLSAGEREQTEEERGRFPPQMVSPFASLVRPQGELRKSWLPLEPLTLDEANLFPIESPYAEREWQAKYTQLWQAFCGQAEKLKGLHEEHPNLEAYLLCFLDLLLRYGWCIPSAFYYDVPDVSLYDHLRTTAAITVCVHEAYSGREGELRALLEALRDLPSEQWPASPEIAVLVEGDISGIQNFIYALRNPRGATAVLRARSFYVQVLTEVLARWILRTLELPPTNLLYCGGGRFRLLVPPAFFSQLGKLRREINEVLLRAHGGALYLALDGVPLVPAHFGKALVRKADGQYVAERGLRAAEDELERCVSSQKNRRFLELPQETLAEFFQPFGEGTETCQICGHVGPTEEDEEEVRWCPSCQSFRTLGRDLRRAKFLRLSWSEPRPLPLYPSWKDVCLRFGFDVEVSEDLWPPNKGLSLVYWLDENAALSPRASQEAVARKFLVNVVATWRQGETPPRGYERERVVEGEIKHFGILAAQSRGAPYLGILRMDMDNLGRIFREGFVRKAENGLLDYGTFSRKHSLSTLLSVFFEGWVGERARRLSENQERVYAVYSGGDDLFFVGSWDAVLGLASDVRDDFRKFSGREDLGISAGFLLVHEKYPLYLAATETGDLLELAKKAREKLAEASPQAPWVFPRKDAICLLGRVVPWEEFPEVKRWKERLVRAVEEAASRRVLFVLQEVWEEYQREREQRGEWGPWLWRLTYWLSRQREAAKKAGQDESLYQELLERLSGKNFAQNVGVLSLAARWAELETREVQGGER